MPKVKATCDEEQGASSSKRRRTEEPPPPQQHHLYLILDDWALGYSIRKIDVSSGAPDPLLQLPNGVGREVAAIRLPPPIFRLNARRGLPMFFTPALGSSIVALHPKEDDGFGRGIPNRGGAVFDVHKSYLEFIHPSAHGPPINLLDLSPMDEDPDLECELGSLSWRELPDAPFSTVKVISYAVLPEERATTIFASVGLMTDDVTYSIQIMADDGAVGACWKRVGEWMLPFHGRGYFDPALNAWVGLSMYCLETGHICACELVSPTSSDCPGWKFSKEKLFSDDPAETHVGATLVYMGGRSRFCLLECVVVYYKKYRRAKHYHFEDKDADQQLFRYFCRTTTFSLRYDENGDLTTGGSQRVRYYKAPKGDVTRTMCEVPVAFWM
ncbi:unnamed protein product [Urochloa decumbens]|uniref:DUF1618 domain-containing protein n=1 Tax=Urochloa decumbens TaxID=240449 RepID=A0ABC8Y6I7_9POAL